MNRLYRLCLRGSRVLQRLKRYDSRGVQPAFASRILTRMVLQNLDIQSFTKGEAALQTFDAGEDLDAKILGDMFREGSSQDFDRLLAKMPHLLRYTRAGTFVNEYHHRLAALRTHKGTNHYSDSSVCLEGAVLVSKLFYDAKKAVGLEERITDGFESLVTEVEDKLELYALSKGADLGSMRVVDKIKAYNMVLRDREALRSQQVSEDKIVHLVDQILDASQAYTFALPIAHSVVFNEVMRRLGVDAVGVTFPRVFMSRIMTQEPYEPVRTASSPRSEGDCEGSEQPRLPLYINVEELEGSYVSHFPAGMQEILVKVNHESGFLEATKVDGDSYVPRGEISWKIALPALEPKPSVDVDGIVRPEGRYLAVGKILRGELQVAKEGFEDAQLLPCMVEVVAMRREDVLPYSSSKDGESGDTHFEIKLHLALDHSMPLVQTAATDSSTDTYGRHEYTQDAAMEESNMHSSHENPDLGLLEPVQVGVDEHVEVPEMVLTDAELRELERELEGLEQAGHEEESSNVVIDLAETVQQDDAYKIDMDAAKSTAAAAEATPVKDSLQTVPPQGMAFSSVSNSVVGHLSMANSHVNPSTARDNTTSSVGDDLQGDAKGELDSAVGASSSSSLTPSSASFNSMSLNFVKTQDIHTCLFCVDSGTASAGPVTPGQYSSLLSRHRSFEMEGHSLHGDDEDEDVTASGGTSSAETTAAAAHDHLSRLRSAHELDPSIMKAAMIAAGVEDKPRGEWTEAEENRVYNAVALAPASVNDIVNRMIGNISVYFDDNDGGADSAYWQAMAAYFDALAQQDAKDVSKMALQDRSGEDAGEVARSQAVRSQALQ